MNRFIVFGLLTILAACGQEDGTPIQQTAQKAAPIKPPPAPLDDTATRLPEGFVSDDIERVISSLKAAGKSEFETTDAYRKRLVDETSAKVYNFLADPLEATYDADRGQMIVRLWLKVDASTTDIEEDSLIVPVRNEVERSTFPASNAFGVQVQVQRITETAHGLAAVTVRPEMIGRRVPSALYQLSDGERYQRFLDVRLPLPPDEARARKDSLKFLLRAQPSARAKARIYEGNYEWKATINSPTSRVSQTHAAYVDVQRLAVWVVDTARGEILAKTSLAELLKMKPASEVVPRQIPFLH